MRPIVDNFLALLRRDRRYPDAIAVISAIAVALPGCASWDQKARQLMYRPTAGAPATFDRLHPGDERYALSVPGEQGGEDRLAIWWLPHPDRNAPTLLYLHGTFRTLYRNYPKIEALREAGFAVVAVDYRGWGESTPIVPSERSIVADADAAWAELLRHQPDPRKRVIYGHSLGGAVAIDLASRKHGGTDYAALIVESSFTTLADLAGSAAGPIGALAALLSGERFDSLSKIGRVDAPIVILHGDRDDTVPVALGRRLRDAAPPGTVWVEVRAGSHSRLFEDDPALYQRTLHTLVTRLSPAAK